MSNQFYLAPSNEVVSPDHRTVRLLFSQLPNISAIRFTDAQCALLNVFFKVAYLVNSADIY